MLWRTFLLAWFDPTYSTCSEWNMFSAIMPDAGIIARIGYYSPMRVIMPASGYNASHNARHALAWDDRACRLMPCDAQGMRRHRKVWEVWSDLNAILFAIIISMRTKNCGIFWTDSAVHHHQNTEWGSILWKRVLRLGGSTPVHTEAVLAECGGLTPY